jgi:hypothetical protein
MCAAYIAICTYMPTKMEMFSSVKVWNYGRSSRFWYWKGKRETHHSSLLLFDQNNIIIVSLLLNCFDLIHPFQSYVFMCNFNVNLVVSFFMSPLPE